MAAKIQYFNITANIFFKTTNGYIIIIASLHTIMDNSILICFYLYLIRYISISGQTLPNLLKINQVALFRFFLNLFTHKAYQILTQGN